MKERIEDRKPENTKVLLTLKNTQKRKPWSPSSQFIVTPPIYQLQAIVKEIPSYVRDTNDFIQKFNQIEEIPEDSLLVTLDGNLYIPIFQLTKE